MAILKPKEMAERGAAQRDLYLVNHTCRVGVWDEAQLKSREERPGAASVFGSVQYSAF